ncbi:MAG TPA: response regulator transcription factor [Solirubrobacterales bacterium]|nr:response regulator transcription factor [Solirubrobacterales bacterium]
MEVLAELESGRDHYARQSWRQAYEALRAADGSAPLGHPDLELLATSAYMLGLEDEYRQALERAYRDYLDAGEPLAAVRCAHWIALGLAIRGELGQAGGWLGRAERLVQREGSDCVERGYLLLPRTIEQEAAGQLESAAAIAAQAVAIGERFEDPDLFSLGSFAQGSALIGLGRFREGLALLDLAMVAVIAGEVSPVSSGIVYCGAILACQEAHELRRAREWTNALTQWCAGQPELVAFTGRCLVHRAQIMRMDGSWQEAIEEARRAAERCLKGENPVAAGEAHYQRGEVHRLRGEHAAAEEAYREASGHGWEPHPGLALLRLAQGDERAADAAIRRVLSEANDPGKRASLLPAYVEIQVAIGELTEAEEGCGELDSIAATEPEPGALAAMAAQTRGRVDLAAGNSQESLQPLRRASELWRQFNAPYENARARELIGLACRNLEDEDTARLELEAARETFVRLGAASDLARIEGPAGLGNAIAPHGLTKRELEVLRLLCAGQTNREIAAALVVSVRTVDRHVSNLYAKLGVSSRAAATTYAHEHSLI